MNAKPWEPTASGTSPAMDLEQQASLRRTLLILAAGGFAADLAVAGWILLGPIDIPEEMRYVVAGAIVLGGVAGLFLLRRIAQRHLGAT